MVEEWKAISDQLTRQLDLDMPPVQVSYLETAPVGVAEHPGGVPSVCTFFAFGAEKPFYASLPKHEDCEVGAFVLGIPPAGEIGGRLMSTIGRMQSVGYLNPGEEAHVPHNATAPKFVAYGPLGSLPMPPTGVLLFTTPKAAMLAVEAAGSGTDARPVSINGRPMCAIMPILNQGTPVGVSLGCTGSRIYTDLGVDKMVVGIRGDHLSRFAEKLGRIVEANAVIASEDAARKRAAPQAHQPA
ncbi:MAG: DUF169 domain-containing protein [Thermoplasmata archaeon]|nr:DUF169 domain-containing protein [Thermoplasmata archaeon]